MISTRRANSKTACIVLLNAALNQYYVRLNLNACRGADVFAEIQSGGQTGFAKQSHIYCQRADMPIEMISIEN